VLPALLLERARRKLSYCNVPKAKLEAFAKAEEETVDQIAGALGPCFDTWAKACRSR
jgi:hypothetical protein